VVERGPEKAGVGSPILSLGTIYKNPAPKIKDAGFLIRGFCLCFADVAGLIAFGALRDLKFHFVAFR
jgi:hypothetical protein